MANISQHKWNTTDGYAVLTGWDSPLQCFFLTIDRECAGCYGTGMTQPDEKATCDVCHGSGDETIYENLDHGDGRMTLIDVEQALKLFLTEYPEEIIMRLAADRQVDRGNAIFSYDDIGETRQEDSA